jgi:hypothetical protein
MMQQWADYLDDLAEDGKVIAIVLDAPRSPSSLIFGVRCGLIRDLDVEVANQARPPFRRVFAQVREQRRTVAIIVVQELAACSPVSTVVFDNSAWPAAINSHP